MSDFYTGEGMFWDRSNHRRRNLQGRQFLRDECTGANHYTGERMYQRRNVQGQIIAQDT